MADDAPDSTTTTPAVPPTPTSSAPPKRYVGDNVNANEFAPRKPYPSLTEGFKTVKLEDFKTVHMQPCVRQSLLYGIGSGFAFGGLKIVLGAPVPKAANWAAGTFAGASLVVYEYCQYRRSKEKEGMKRAVEIIDRRKAEKEKKLREKKEAEALLAAERAAAEEARKLAESRRWYKFW
ncbi:hypothetical protein RUND412_004553 [Rhizina undulata]